MSITVLADGMPMWVRPTESGTMYNVDIAPGTSIYSLKLPPSFNVRFGAVSSNHVVIGRSGTGGYYAFQATSSEGYVDGAYWVDKYPQVNVTFLPGEAKVINYGWGSSKVAAVGEWVFYTTEPGITLDALRNGDTGEIVSTTYGIEEAVSPVSPYVQVSTSSNLVGTAYEYPTAPVVAGTSMSILAIEPVSLGGIVDTGGIIEVAPEALADYQPTEEKIAQSQPPAADPKTDMLKLAALAGAAFIGYKLLTGQKVGI